MGNLYKIGDKVVVVDHHYGVPVGTIGTIENQDLTILPNQVRLSGDLWWMYDDQIAPVIPLPFAASVWS